MGRANPSHITILETAFANKMDVVCVQEPWTASGTKTSNHPGFDLYAPTSSWDWEKDDSEQREEQRPLVLTYVRRGPGLKVQQRKATGSKALLWIDVNDIPILNCYRRPGSDEVIDYVTHLAPPPKLLVGGDFNVWHDHFEPGVQPLHRGGELADWSIASAMDYIGDAGVPTQKRGHVIDLTFSNIPWTYTSIRDDMQCGSDHMTQVTVIPGRGNIPLEQFHYRVPDSELFKFAGLVKNGMAKLPNPWEFTTVEQIDSYTNGLSEVFKSATETAGKQQRGQGCAAPWWTDDCKSAFQEHLNAQTRPLPDDETIRWETRNFHSIVRRAKRDYWRHIIDGVNDDKQLYKVIGWHKLASNLKSPPLVLSGVTVEDTMEKAETLRSEILDRFSSADDLETNPLDNWDGTGHLQWDREVSMEEVERNTIGVSSTSPGTDKVTVRLLKACWDHIKDGVHGLYSQCLNYNHFPKSWRLAEVAMLPKVGEGKKDKSSVRNWRPIALLSCISKGFERIIARRLAWTALTTPGLMSPQHCGALPKRSATDLIAAFTHDVEAAFAAKKQVTMVTMDVQGAFDALLKRRLLQRMTKQGWPLPLLQLVDGFLSDRQVRVRLEKSTTPFHNVGCGTPQGSPLSPVLYMLYLAELLLQDTTLRFGYADDLCLYRVNDSLNQNVAELAVDIQSIIDYGDANKIFFAPEKLEMIHLTRKAGDYAPPIVVNDNLTIHPITTAPKEGDQPALKWLGVWFDRKCTFKRHVAERAKTARKVAHHIRSLAQTIHGPPAASLRKAVITCVLPALLYGTEAWYAGRTKPTAQGRSNRGDTVSARIGSHVILIEKTLALAARGVLPVWKTTPTVTLFRDSGLPSAMAALEEAKLRFAMRLQTLDKQHPLVPRIRPPMIIRGIGAGTRQRPKTKVQRLGTLLPATIRPILVPPHYSPGCRTDPTHGVSKEKASAAFKEWWAALPPSDVTIFSDGSEQVVDGHRQVGYGYAIYQTGAQIASGYGSITDMSHVFDAEAIGAWQGLKHVIHNLPEASQQKLWLCIDSTSVIWCLQGNASPSSQWALLNCQEAMKTHNIEVKWSPGHTGIEGNEAADKLADLGAKEPTWDTGFASIPTISGIRSVFRTLRDTARADWWTQRSTKLSSWYKKWDTSYTVKPLEELSLSRPILHRYLALRSSHGDFAWYHTKFNHDDAVIVCSCRRSKTPEHLVLCRKAQSLTRFRHWPNKPREPPSTKREALSYLRRLMAKPQDFARYLAVTEFYSKICTR